MASLFLVRGCLCLPILCALKVMLHKRRGEYQESVWEQVMGQLRAVEHRLINPSKLYKAELGAFLILDLKFLKRIHHDNYFYFTFRRIRPNHSINQLLFNHYFLFLLYSFSCLHRNAPPRGFYCDAFQPLQPQGWA